MKSKFFLKANKAPILKLSSNIKCFPKKIVKTLKQHHYGVENVMLSGDAPKDFIYVYEYGRCRRSNPKKWIRYIAKIGHKWYPSESITEHLLTRLGQTWGFNVANSKLYIINGQIRFCSELFRNSDQELVHGADILSRCLQESNPLIIEQIDKNGWSQELLTLQFVKQAITEVFPDESDEILNSLYEMLIFDAITGNNDRHFFNWGILRNLKSKHKPFFSPIYDTARGLFWNFSDEKLLDLSLKKLLTNRIVKYHNETKPKIGWEGIKEINHFQLIEKMLQNNICSFDAISSKFSNDNFEKAKLILSEEFDGLISDIRKEVILGYLSFRFENFNKLMSI